MKQTDILEVLMHLFRYHMQSNCQLSQEPDVLYDELEEAGFSDDSIEGAFLWLERLQEESKSLAETPSQNSIRVFSSYEMDILTVECCGFLLCLEQNGILSPTTRELVIAQLLEFEGQKDPFDLSLVKWVTLMVLFNQPNGEQALACMEHLVLNGNVVGNC